MVKLLTLKATPVKWFDQKPNAKINLYFWKVFQSFGVECENDANDCVVTQLFSIHLGHLKGESELEARAGRGSSESWNLLSYYVQNVPKLGRRGRATHCSGPEIWD